MNRLIAGEIVDITKAETPYVYREYPKWVTLADGSQIVVNDADEEQAAIGAESSVEVGYDNLRDALMAEAKALGLQPHHRTGADKLREMIDSATKGK
jgi:hypothetical protein